MSRPLAVSLILVAFFLGTGFGFFVTPEYSALGAGGAMDAMGGEAADRLSDLRFLNGLIRHHEQAIDLARQAGSASTRPEIQALAEAIVTGMPARIDELYGWKRSWYRDSRRVQGQRLPLGGADANFDLRFLNAMISHHEEAIAMARGIQRLSTRNDVLTLASEVIRLDTADIAQFEAWRQLWYGVK